MFDVIGGIRVKMNGTLVRSMLLFSYLLKESMKSIEEESSKLL